MTRRELIAGMAVAGALGKREGDAMQGLKKAKILFSAGFGPIVRDMDASRKLYVKALEINFKEEDGGYLHTDTLSGAKTFALWPLLQTGGFFFCKRTWPGVF